MQIGKKSEADWAVEILAENGEAMFYKELLKLSAIA